MSKKHGAKQQKKLAKQKAKRSEKRKELAQRTSVDPTIRLRNADKWPVVEALASATLWEDGIGYLALARQESEGNLVIAVFLVDVYCLGVKNTLWELGTRSAFRAMIEKLSEIATMDPIAPACLAKIVKGAVEYARSFGFPPHIDYRHTGLLLDGIDPATCSQEFTFGKDGKPFYMQGPNESSAQAAAITQRVVEAGGHYVVSAIGADLDELSDVEDDDDPDALEDDSPDELPLQ